MENPVTPVGEPDRNIEPPQEDVAAYIQMLKSDSLDIPLIPAHS